MQLITLMKNKKARTHQSNIKANFRSPLAPILLTLMIFFFLSPSTTFAQSIGLSITPPVIEITLKPNTNLIQAINIKNLGEDTIVTPNLANIKPIGSRGQVIIDIGSLDLQATGLSISIQNSDRKLGLPFTIKKGESTQIVLKIESASTNDPIDSYLALVLSANPPTITTTDSLTTPSISTLILTSILPSNIVPIDLELSQFNTPKIQEAFSPLTLSPIVKNNTGTMIRPVGKIEILDRFDQVIHTQELYPHLILGNHSRTLQITTGSDPSVSKTFSWTPRFHFGPHKLKLTLTTLSGTIILEESRSLWILPLQGLVYLIVAIILALTLITHYKRKSTSTPPIDNS